MTDEFEDEIHEIDALNLLGVIYIRLGKYEQAVDLYHKIVGLLTEVDYPSKVADVVNNIAIAHSQLGQHERAIELLQFALNMDFFEEHQGARSRVLSNIGVEYAAFGAYEQALDYYRQSLAIRVEIGDRSGESVVLNHIGAAYQALGHYEQALVNYQDALLIHEELGLRPAQSLTLDRLGSLYLLQAQYAEAESVLLEAVSIFEFLKDEELEDVDKVALFETQLNTYEFLQQVLIAQNKDAIALEIAERGRARATVELLADRISDRATQEIITTAPKIAEIQRIASEHNTTLVTYSIIDNPTRDTALYIWVVQPTGEIEFREVEFEGSGEGGLAINPIASIDGLLYRGNPDLSELDTLVADSRSILIESTDSSTTPTEKLQELHQLLIDPIVDLLPSDPNAQVAFIPQGELFLVPFAALQDEDGTYLIEKHTILTAPSIQVFGLANESRSLRLLSESRPLRGVEGDFETENALIVGNPTMPTVWLPTDEGFAETQLSYLSGAKAEAEAIGEFFNIPVLTGEQATEARIKQELPNASLIHLATHGLLEYGIPESSGVLDIPGAIALAPGNGEDGLLTSAEILEMDLQADLAILSACDTGRGRITGDGVVGLSRALITAGVPSVMVSLWAVNDDSTSLLMQRFYEFLAAGDITKAQALRQAQLSLLYGEDVETRLEAIRAGAAPQYREGFEPVGNRHPYHWAPFVLMGDGQ